MSIGILNLQGDVVEHQEHLQRLGVEPVLVKKAAALRGLAGLILPGGESTCLGRLLRIFELDTVICDEVKRGMKVWGTCAGAILIAERVEGENPHLALMNITVARNAFGSQLDSFTTQAVIPAIHPEPQPLVFIRAPKITEVGFDIEVLLTLGDYVAAAESDECLATVFHPELTPGLAFHRYFLEKCGVLTPDAEVTPPAWDPQWSATSWTQLAAKPERTP